MKTRIIQDDPGEPVRAGSDDPGAAVGAPAQSRNVAARMARWSAHHRKKAIFGWLALAVALFAISYVSPLKQIVFETSGPGESGRADAILYNDFKQPAGESVIVESATLTADTPEFKAVVSSVVNELACRAAAQRNRHR